MAKSGKKLLQRFRVPLGFVFGGLFLVFAKPTPSLMMIGFIVAFIGILIRAWSSGHIRKNQELAISGPYSFTRNPLYLGSFILGLGCVIGSGNWWLGLLFVALFLGIYLPVMNVEADELKSIFGDKYLDYASKVPLFFPGFGQHVAGPNKFDMSLYLRYREYRAFFGLISVFFMLGAKVYFKV